MMVSTGPPTAGGFGCSGGDYPSQTAACAHHVCGLGVALDPTCDANPPVTSTTVLFEDNFDMGNAAGWTLDPTWEIGPARASVDQSFGDSDPSSDATPGGDNMAAGTRLGGSIGGPRVLFSDTFSNLNNWTETGEGDWNTEVHHSSFNYGGASGSQAAHVDNCDSVCVLLGNTLDLSGQTGADLRYWRFLDSQTDFADFLLLDLFNGFAWERVRIWRGTNGNFSTATDNRWLFDSIDLSSYLVPGFRMRFVARATTSSEHMHVDDIQVVAPAQSQITG